MDHTPPPEGPIEIVGSNAKRVGLGLLKAILPAFAMLIYINTFFSSQSETSQRALIASNALSQRATLIKADHDRLVNAVETTLGAAVNDEIEIALRLTLPEAESWQVVPLGDMGVASLRPADYGLESLVLLDRVRQTFNTGETRFEVVRQNDEVVLALVSRYDVENEQGVAVVMFSNTLTDRWVSASSAGAFSLWQIIENAPGNRVAGPMADITSSPAVTIENTDWRLSFSPSPSLVTADLSLNPLIWLFVLGGAFGAVWLCILEPRKRLEANVKRMLTAADNREPLSLDYPELAPIAQVLR